MTSPNKKITIAKFLTRTIEASHKTQKEIATEIGYENPNIITMFKTGATKLPMTTVGPMATALGVDPAYLLRLALSEYCAETYNAIERCLGSPILTERERLMIESFRRCTDDADPPVIVFDGKRAVAVAFA
ncbi:XRE family transcriptional regulator [Denitromonas ohlonensis]|uniref:XRE family transcriptional regulator n=2 Tax=Denitromonas TaxID=139331 RepID=A0A557R5V4_9RHOO|nr:XRE family transcriptional regulator [Denitromonas ohlonensis]TVO60555.1 XRE family transcriptional regulator [Denitromonas ohlonensis]TVO72285.1 XRE family transcriptional regulator [Denitromonas ohlonensis]